MDGKDASPRDAIDEMHRYRDAILYRRGDGSLQQPNREAIGAYVIFPGRSGDKSYEYAEKRAVENIGAIPLLPGAEGEAKLVGFIKEIIAKRTAKDHLAADIPTRGTTVVVGEAVRMLDLGEVDNNVWQKVFDKSVCLVPKEKLDEVGMSIDQVGQLRMKTANKPVTILTVRGLYNMQAEPQCGKLWADSNLAPLQWKTDSKYMDKSYFAVDVEKFEC
jgi:hypothetical protein